jgi:predicted PurR-regulated permease PerM
MTTATHGVQNGWFTRERVLVIVLTVITAGVFYLCYLLALPFVPAIAWALAAAVVAHPLHEWIRRRLRRKSLAAGLSVLLVAITILAPAVFVIQQVTNDAASSLENLKNSLAGDGWREIAQRNALVANVVEWIEREVNVQQQIEQAAANLLKMIKGILSGSIYVGTGLLITLFLLFYFFRDKDTIVGGLRKSLPLSPRETDDVFRNVQDTIYAIVYGSLFLALVQGTLGGIMFWILGLPSPLLWGSVMAVLAVLPVLGAAIIWVPAALYLALTGSIEKALILTAWGALAIGLIDNLLYPLIVKGRLRLHTVPVFISIVGGLVAFGAVGLVLGPVVLALAVALADVWRRRMGQGDAVEDTVDAEKAAEDVAEPQTRRRRAAK